MADVRTDDMIGTVEIRTEDFQAIRSIELFPKSFRVNDSTSQIDFAGREDRDEILEQVADAILAMARHELADKTRPGAVA